MGTVHRDYAVTLTGSAADLDAFEDALESGLPEVCMLGGPGFGAVALVFTVEAVDPTGALAVATSWLRNAEVVVPDGASLSVLEHEAVAA